MPDKLNIVHPSDTVENQLKMIVYGDPGVGKTVFSTTAPKPLILSVEAGLLSIADKDVDVVEINTWEQMQETFEFIKNGKHDYQTIVLDSLTEIQKKHQDIILGGNPRLSLQQWGDNISAIRRLVRSFRDLPHNVLITALASEQGEDGVPLKRIDLNGKGLPSEVCGFVDLVGYMVAVEEKLEDGETIIKRAIRFQPNANITAKDRSGKLSVLEKPDFQAILNKVYPKTVKTGGSK